MTNHRPPYLLVLHPQDEPNSGPLPQVAEASLALCLGHLTIHTDDPAFPSGYQEGQAQYQQCHAQDTTIDASLLLLLVGTCWSEQASLQMWQAGYVVGWLCALFTQATSGRAESEAQP